MKLTKHDKTKKQAEEPRTNLTERIYQTLKDDIFSFRLLPGDRFSENEIAERVAASRTPVREALARLQREGFVDVSFRSGWQVKPF
ncbi:MAG: GntR family transcriptional regulator, partial [Cellvibrio sp.]|nr:GntR family transcriptional regulator [Cellvibrio sp.]